MASIRKRGNKYQAQVRRQGFAPAVKTFHTKQDAQAWARLMETKADRGDMPVSVKELSNYKIADIIKRYRDEVVVKKRSCETETYILNAFLKDPIANLTFAQITKARFVSYRDKRRKVVKAATVNRELGIISHAFNIAIQEWDLPIKHNPIADLKKLKMNNARNRRLEPKEYLTILRATRHYSNKNIAPIIQLALRTAMRRGEIINMRWEHINFNKSILHIPVTKNGHPRDIPLCRHTTKLLMTLEPQKNGRVFEITANAFRLTWQRLLKRTDIHDLHFHDLRHEAISRFFEMGLNVPEVALISGHRDYRMLFRYTHMKAESVVEKLR